MFKKILMIGFIAFGFCQAQPFGKSADGFRIIRSFYSNTSGEEGQTKFLYNEKGILTRGFWSLKDGSRHSVNYYEHNANGNILSVYRDFSDSLTSFERMTYTKNGDKIAEYFSSSDGRSGSATCQYEEGLLASADLDHYKGWLTGQMKFRYNTEKRLVSAQLFHQEKAVADVDYRYDPWGNLIEETWDFAGKWGQKFLYQYENLKLPKNFYSSPFLQVPHGVRILKEDYSFNGEINGASFYQYNENGLLKIKNYVRSDSVSTITHFEYDGEGKLSQSYRSYSDRRRAYFTYHYDERKNLVARNCIIDKSLAGYEYYFYDAENQLVKAVLSQFDGWLSGVILFEHTPGQEIKRGYFRDQTGLNAEISFTYEKDLCTEILWNFSDGRFQKYNFIYTN
ncbi:MAG: hypothetical protein JXQ65_16570 [Candidatus Marinimicrobia bacterium]|nr:hypothetical protein [Candidatus Neomarinimicrobiota bacterium]